jgi:hypothetical protein
MVATLSNPQFFQPEGQAGWHANTDAERTALCGKATLRYNIDSISDVPPAEGLCPECDAILNNKVVSVPEVAQPAKAKRSRGKK